MEPDATPESESNACMQFDGAECLDKCGDDAEPDNSLKCDNNKVCCFKQGPRKCEGEFFRCSENGNCSGHFVDGYEGCEGGKRCCKIEPCVDFDEGTCRAQCDPTKGEKEHYNCTVEGKKCCWAELDNFDF